jgi:ribosomal-protein-alanine N-acetyltransferase
MILPNLQTSRLRLRPHSESDIPDLVRLAGEREIAATTLRIAHPYTEQNAEDFLAMSQENNKAWFAIALLSNNRLIGGVGLRIDPEHDHAEIGYWIGVPYWGKGYATEAAHEVMRYGFEDLNLHRIHAACFSRNAASEKILLKLGMRHEGHMREHQRKWGDFIDVAAYGILRSEWQNRSANGIQSVKKKS